MGGKTIPDSAEPRLESFYPPFVAGIDLPHQGVADSYNPPFPSYVFLDGKINTHKHLQLEYKYEQWTSPKGDQIFLSGFGISHCIRIFKNPLNKE